jgi:hypothetical protein
MYPQNQTAKYYGLLAVVAGVAVMACIYMVIHTFQQNKSSGELTVTTPNSDSLISISQDNKSAVFIGSGQASVRLTPGTYLVGVARQGRFSSQVVRVIKGSAASASLSATTTPLLPASTDIDFQGTKQLIASGMTTAQVNTLRESIFAFQKDTKSAVVATNSVTTPPFNPDGASLLISRVFTLIIDGQSYRATTTWVDLDTATLQLTNTSGAVVYDSTAGHD